MLAIQVIPDRFTEIERSTKDSLIGSASASEPFIRRPTRGISIRDDTFATLRVVSAKNENLRLIDAGSKRKDGSGQALEINGKRATDIYSNFLLQQVSEERMEKSQILETFGEPFIFLFGERPKMMAFSGVLANTADFNWEAEWWHNYDNYLRGTRCVENDCRVYLSVDNTLIGGYILASSATKSSTERNFVNFQFQMFVTSYTSLTDVGNPYAAPGLDVQLTGMKTGEFDAVMSAEAAAQFRPNLLADFGRIPISGFTTTGNGQVQMPSLEQGIVDRLAVVSSAWNSARDVVTNAISGISGLLNGDHVRVPVGFAGSLAFDEEADIQLQTVANGGIIKYTTFADNADEYVGVGDHYGSSSPQSRDGFLALLGNLGYNTFRQELLYGQSLVDKATEIWNSHGIEIPDEQMGPLSSFLVGRGLGLAGVAATKAVSSASGPINSSGAAAARFAGSLPNPTTVIEE